MNTDMPIGFAVGILFCLITVVPVSCSIKNYEKSVVINRLRTEAIENKCASYNAETGKFEWNDEKDK